MVAILSKYRVSLQEIASEIEITPTTLSRALKGETVPLPIVARGIREWVAKHEQRYPAKLEEDV